VKSIVILISGRGSNMRSIVSAAREQRWPARIAAVISNRADASGLDWAREQGIATEVIEHGAFPSRDAFDDALGAGIDGYRPDVIVLAGFMRILGEAFVNRYEGRLLNIHPSLLPSFPGLRTHRQALQYGVKAHGCTVHFVTAKLDHGPVIVQAVVPVLDGDDEDRLAARVLEQEHVVYPQAVRWIVEGRVTVRDGLVRVAGDESGQCRLAGD
jgi:phosphoribosylglycinamide formyltransferase-1